MSQVRHFTKRIGRIRSLYETYSGRQNGWNWKWARMEEMFVYRTNNFGERNRAMSKKFANQ